MNSKNNVKTIDENETKDNELESVRVLLTVKGRYHNHKEIMAHAAMLLQIGFFVAIMTVDSCPPKWLKFSFIQDDRFLGYVVTYIAYVIVWGIITSYMWWQLWNRRIAANQVDKLVKAIKEKSSETIKSLIQEMEDVRGSTSKPIIGEVIVWVANWFILFVALFKIGSLC